MGLGDRLPQRAKPWRVESPAPVEPHARVPAALREELAFKARTHVNEGGGRYTPATGVLLVCLIDRIPRGGELRLSQAGLADMAGMSRRSVQRHSKVLEMGGYIMVERERMSAARFARHIYRLADRVETLVYASTVRQIGAGNNMFVVKDSYVYTTTESCAKKTHGVIEAIVAEGHDEKKARAYWTYAERHGAIKNIAGWVRKALAGDWRIAAVDEYLEAQRREELGPLRYVMGEYGQFSNH
jgi:DNA-binding transcriptional ArsR family regulator